MVIVGGSEVGIETAMYLCGKGHDVTVLTRQKKLAHNASGLHYITMAFVKAGPNQARQREASAWEAYDNLTGITEAETVKVEGNTVTYRMADGERARLHRRQRGDLRRHDPADRRGLWLLRSYHRVLCHRRLQRRRQPGGLQP